MDRLQVSPSKAVVEIKTTSGFASNQWEYEIPPYYIAQCQAYMMLTGLQLCKLVILRDGRYLDVYDIIESIEFQKTIESRCSDFYYHKILPARRLKEEGKNFESLEPAPDSSEAYTRFLSKRFASKPIRIEGTAEMFETAQNYLKAHEEIKRYSEKKALYGNRLRHYMKEAEEISFGAAGSVSWKENSKGTRILKVE